MERRSRRADKARGAPFRRKHEPHFRLGWRSEELHLLLVTGMDVSWCLPESLRDQPIARVGVGQSGAGVYAVGDRHVLKVSPTLNPEVLRAAAAAGVAPALVHVDEARGAIVMERVADPFPPLMMRDPQRAVALLGQTLRRVHDLPVPSGEPADP